METNLNTKIYNADLYLRLSKEDGDKEESDSITNQKELILDYLKTMEDIKIHEIRVDDGYSGVNFDRPAFQQMLEDIKTGKVDCVITKDLSRFGRNHIEVGKYLEKIFPYLGVRFIAINDNYDSAKSDTQTDNIIIPFKNLINDAYCRDISIKIRSNLEVKRKKGDFVGAFAPYGYRKSEADKNRLQIDEEAAETVRRIFRMYLQGSSAYRIAEVLNGEDMLTPMDYKKERGSAFYTGFKKNLKSKWSHVHVLRILGNPVYMGTLIQGKDTTPNYKVKKKVKKEEENGAGWKMPMKPLFRTLTSKTCRSFCGWTPEPELHRKRYMIYQGWFGAVTAEEIWSEKPFPPGIRNLFIMCAETIRRIKRYVVLTVLMRRIWKKVSFCY